MLNFDNKELRNLQEQVGKNKEDIAALKTGIKISYWVQAITDIAELTTDANVGKYILLQNATTQKLYTITRRKNEGLIAVSLGDYPVAGEQGEQGPQGSIGITGSAGRSIYGVASTLPSTSGYLEGDWFLLTNGNLYKNINSTWVLQTSIKGTQGVKGDPGDQIEINPAGEATGGNANKIEINGVIYTLTSIISADEKKMLEDLVEYVEVDEDGSFTFGHDLYADGNIQAGYDVEVGRNLYIDDITKIQDPDGNQLAQGKLTAGENITIVDDVISASGGGSSLPEDPTTNGNYVLTNNIASGTSTKGWDLQGIKTLRTNLIAGVATGWYKLEYTITNNNGTRHIENPLIYWNASSRNGIAYGTRNNGYRFGIANLTTNGTIFLIHTMIVGEQYQSASAFNLENFSINQKTFPIYYSTGCLYYNGSALSWTPMTKLYKHEIEIEDETQLGWLSFTIINNSSTPLNTLSLLRPYIYNTYNPLACNMRDPEHEEDYYGLLTDMNDNVSTGYIRCVVAKDTGDDYGTPATVTMEQWGYQGSHEYLIDTIVDSVIEL